MPHFGVLSFKGAGHLNPMIALARELVARGHRVTFFQTDEVKARVRAQGMEFRSIGAGTARPEVQEEREHRSRCGQELEALRDGVERIARDMELFLQAAHPAMEGCGIDAILMDEIALAGPTLAEMLRLPYIVISTAVPHSFGWRGSGHLRTGSGLLERLQRMCFEVSVLRMRGPVRRRLDALRRARGMGSVGRMKRTYPELAHISQLPQCLDLPRILFPPRFYYAGPLVDHSARPMVDFPWECLDGRTLVYASLGTSRSSEISLFELIAAACEELRLQLVISLGGRREPESLPALRGDPIVRREVPQLEMLQRADIIVSHGGLNTALETMLEGKPMIVIPRTFDQPAVAVRMERSGAAVALSSRERSVVSLRAALIGILTKPQFRQAALAMQAALRTVQGPARAANIIEDSLWHHTLQLSRHAASEADDKRLTRA